MLLILARNTRFSPLRAIDSSSHSNLGPSRKAFICIIELNFDLKFLWRFISFINSFHSQIYTWRWCLLYLWTIYKKEIIEFIQRNLYFIIIGDYGPLNKTKRQTDYNSTTSKERYIFPHAAIHQRYLHARYPLLDEQQSNRACIRSLDCENADDLDKLED